MIHIPDTINAIGKYQYIINDLNSKIQNHKNMIEDILPKKEIQNLQHIKDKLDRDIKWHEEKIKGYVIEKVEPERYLKILNYSLSEYEKNMKND